MCDLRSISLVRSDWCEKILFYLIVFFGFPFSVTGVKILIHIQTLSNGFLRVELSRNFRSQHKLSSLSHRSSLSLSPSRSMCVSLSFSLFVLTLVDAWRALHRYTARERGRERRREGQHCTCVCSIKVLGFFSLFSYNNALSPSPLLISDNYHGIGFLLVLSL